MTNEPQTANETDDGRLVARVRAAVANRVAAAGLAAFVGKPPVVDTSAGGSMLMLKRVDFAADPEHASERLDRDAARSIIYWSRPVPGDDPHIVGVQVGDGGAARVFFAVILPPG